MDRHGDYLFRYALARVCNEAVAEDLVQDALLAAFEAKDRFSIESSERGWLTGILKHKILDHFRRLARERTVNEDESLLAELQNRFDDVGLWKREPEVNTAEKSLSAAARERLKHALERKG